jgi:quercetin dioxygenase-like cupin family protein
MTDIITGDGWSVGDLDALGEGPGFRKVRAALGVTEFGVNAVVLPPRFSTPTHFHERQQELYFVHRGRIEFTLDGEPHELGPGGFARVDPGTVRSVRNLSDTEDAVFVAVGGEGGYVGRDGRNPEPASP